MRFSFIVPVYNAEEFLPQCIESIERQEESEFELVLVNDGSTDGSGKICDAYAQKYDNIKVIHKENEGQVKARIDGVNASSGEYILFGDADDWYDYSALNTIKACVIKDEPDIIFYGFNEVQGELIKECKHCPAVGVYKDKVDILSARMICNVESLFKEQYIFPAVWCRVVKRELLLTSQEKVGASLKIGEDLVLLVYCMLNSKKIVVLDDCLYNYRIVQTSVSHRYSESQFKELILLKNELEKSIDTNKFEYQEQVDLFVLKSLWNGVVKVCTNYSRSHAIRILNTDVDFLKLLRNIKWSHIPNIGLKMRLMLFLVKYERWGILSFCVKMKFRGKRHG